MGAQGFGTLGPGGLSDVTGQDMRLRLVLLFCSLCCAAGISTMLFFTACLSDTADRHGRCTDSWTNGQGSERKTAKQTNGACTNGQTGTGG